MNEQNVQHYQFFSTFNFIFNLSGRNSIQIWTFSETFLRFGSVQPFNPITAFEDIQLFFKPDKGSEEEKPSNPLIHLLFSLHHTLVKLKKDINSAFSCPSDFSLNCSDCISFMNFSDLSRCLYFFLWGQMFTATASHTRVEKLFNSLPQISLFTWKVQLLLHTTLKVQCVRFRWKGSIDRNWI